jgi:hypothetical protein
MGHGLEDRPQQGGTQGGCAAQVIVVEVVGGRAAAYHFERHFVAGEGVVGECAVGSGGHDDNTGDKPTVVNVLFKTPASQGDTAGSRREGGAVGQKPATASVESRTPAGSAFTNRLL